ncbi:MAG: TVP38/TMEM64 family protein [Proteobacteria bacterium]|nr:TVP38/TMEM64 family protein [Pseudomonadota bacterium]
MKKFGPFLFLALIFILFYALNLNQYFAFSALQNYHHLLKEEVGQHLFLSLFIFGASYIIIAATSLPIAVFLTILGGFLFGPVLSLLIVDISATLGTTLLFLAVKTSFGEIFQKKASLWIKKMEKGFQENAFSYLLFLRLVPIFPFWAVTIVSALLDVRLKTFFIATFIGILPGTFVYSIVGNGLGALLKEGKTPDIYIILSPGIFLPLCGLALLALLPILYKNRKDSF